MLGIECVSAWGSRVVAPKGLKIWVLAVWLSDWGTRVMSFRWRIWSLGLGSFSRLTSKGLGMKAGVGMDYS